VIIQLKKENAPFMIGVHCMSHYTNLIVQTLSIMSIVRKIEDVLQSLYAYYFHSPKKTQEFVDLVNIVEIRGQQVLRNIKTYWISMLLQLRGSCLSIVP
jgi:hypothetical protein